MSVLGIIGDILSIFGLGSSRSDRGKSNGSSSTDVRIERESGDGEAATENEAAVKGTEESPEHEESEAVDADTEDEEPVAAETDATASTGSMADESGESEVAEDAEATGVTEHAGTEESAAEPAEAAGPVPTEPEAGEEPVDSVSGIGPAYAKRLNEAGVESVADLVAADAAEVADETGISEKRVRGWQDAAE
ncbi:helix-hairpin-helix domain-containing protein [Salinirubellus salinus]|uniref:helix-hairpin-helix domain-containing protein n=1 Tax=Salinirubellus salinus TaxID=1364945 RepID=UPI0026E54597|nr:helix-hairpin-helix domain-containing protein [Salinirubellus salinus]